METPRPNLFGSSGLGGEAGGGWLHDSAWTGDGRLRAFQASMQQDDEAAHPEASNPGPESPHEHEPSEREAHKTESPHQMPDRLHKSGAFLGRLMPWFVLPAAKPTESPIVDVALTGRGQAGAPNRVCNQKYRVYSFLPAVLYEQFRYFFNLYFLMVALSQLVPMLRVGFLFTYILPLAIVLAVTLLREAVDEWARWRRDRVLNSARYERWTDCPPHSKMCVSAEHLQVGHIVEVPKDARVPADLVVLHTGARDGRVFIRTDGLDGETDWKLRHAIPSVQKRVDEHGMAAFLQNRSGESGRVTVGPAIRDIYRFEGSYHGDSGEDGNASVSLGLEHVVWAGSVVASDGLVGLVVYTGADTREQRNSSLPRTKVGRSDEEINRLSKILFGCAFALAFALVMLDGFQGPWGVTLCRFLILFSSIIPISLRVNLDLVKTYSSYQMTRDAAIPGTLVRNSGIPEELGRIEFLLTDKTGTLTRNVMRFKRMHLGLAAFAASQRNDLRALLAANVFAEQRQPMTPSKRPSALASPLQETLPGSSRKGTSSHLRAMLTAMSICHNVFLTHSSHSVDGPKSNHLVQEKEMALDENVHWNVNMEDLKKYGDHEDEEDSDEEFEENDDEEEEEEDEILEEFFDVEEEKSLYSRNHVDEEWGGNGPSTGGRRPASWKKRNVQPSMSDDSDDRFLQPNEHGEENQGGGVARAVSPRKARKKARYIASSPDEVALVTFCERVGVRMRARNAQWMELQLPHGVSERYEILAVFPFTSESRRMGILVREGRSGALRYYVKGADAVVAPMVRSSDWLDEACGNYSREGLRTLVFACRTLSEADYTKFAVELQLARNALDRREDRIDEVRRLLERDLQLLGVTGVEDRLQPRVPETLETLRNAGVRVWMLTGDKVETAKCIARSSRLVDRAQPLVELRAADGEAALSRQLLTLGSSSSDLALLVDGESLHVCLERHADEFVGAAMRASAVVCCRCTPTQKAAVVRALKTRTGRIVAAVGDGGNDVAMIQAADVGVGLEGQEGKQASLAADFSVPQFAHLKRLLLWHGRNSYQRSARLSHFIFHRGLVISFIQAVFSAIFYFSAIAVFNGWLSVGYTTVFTMVPVWCLSLDEEVPEPIAFRFPELYRELLKGRELSARSFLLWVLQSTYQGAALMLLSLVFFESALRNLVAIVFTALILTELVNVWLELHRWSRAMVLAELGTLAIYVASMVWLRAVFDMAFLSTADFVQKVAVLVLFCCLPVYLFKRLRSAIAPTVARKLSAVDLIHPSRNRL